MIEIKTLCIKVSDTKMCPHCLSKKIIKNGRTKTLKQQYYCKECYRRFIDYYTYHAYHSEINRKIVVYTKEGLGIRSIARVLGISVTTVLKRLLAIAKALSSPLIAYGKEYEVDEICSYVRHKGNKIWITYAMERDSGNVVSFSIGRRTKTTLSKVITTLLYSRPKRIYTDGLHHYRYLIPQNIHKVSRYGTNKIERLNLTLRTKLRRLNRRTICFSKSLCMFMAIMKIYFWY
ncbi:IS1 family transposase [Riemerella anatipestifer]|uniref:Is1 transposase n=1 Tax=Riemerella anatipestifer (strain ATCC 11845 / DSM 15868 / JCM 9532 / NCTC 11014) TaxID=693978 RepID=E4TD95_RIEAD|nr:IS1 family transposase [Riemerella anatipestifer]ADQ82754.1 IS1 transposase [Riemerella anatipestifer ATCC 11845 = DSM 15868]ADZ11755.1 IS1 transposase [Riemerella anatipestifer RA-GD]AFD56763.1 is1 transposase [Riemerella anatipestifer ATCC 11845 = DSM 15868]AKQ40350.1 transposase [Riemerella anatipestifer Yb2]EFT35548.1 IS1 transposase [Riemerella anatipestifer RA-YM]